jgi:hypothetical protein
MTKLPLVTIGLSSHRLESLPYAFKEMGKHEAIILEEAPEPDFPLLLAGALTIDAYLMDKDTEFPEFTGKQLEMLKELHGQGKGIFQVEPYLERLIQIHELLAEGLARPEVEKRPGLEAVYEAEARTSAALLTFYTRAHHASFSRVLAAVQDFARADAVRFRLRDDLRAQALVAHLNSFASLYVEAGHIHLFLVNRLRCLLAGQARVRPTFLLASSSLKELGRPRPLGPGDLLTLRYIFNTPLEKEQERLLAARSLIYIKLLAKDELAPTADHPTPHTADEIQAHRLTAALSFQDCEKLYPEIRRLPPEDSVEVVRRYLTNRSAES